MKTFKLLICALLLFSNLHAQNERSVFRKGYLRLGISTLGNNLDQNLTPKENVFKGNYGASTGYVFEAGHVFYFRPKSYKGKVNFGLDWTILSAAYNKLDKWEDYSGNASDVYIDGASFSASAASKLGPVVSFNLVEKLVLDARFQVVAVGRVTPFEYYENESGANIKSFAFYNYGQEEIEDSYDAENVKNAIAFGIGTNFGITIRRKAIGLSLDYNSVKANTSFDAYEGEANHSYGKQKIPTNSFQVKLSFTL
ncbi:MAG TPA: hypothetical protein VFW07_06635 [Parafilimonas sp.]|nr:hypothetical protein [Parafilimonas sp.]